MNPLTAVQRRQRGHHFWLLIEACVLGLHTYRNCVNLIKLIHGGVFTHKATHPVAGREPDNRKQGDGRAQK